MSHEPPAEFPPGPPGPPGSAGPPGPPHPPGPPAKPRPSGWWFAFGGTLMLLAAIGFVVMFVVVLRALLEVEATVPVDGQSHHVSLDGDGDRMIFVEADAPRPSCVVLAEDDSDGYRQPSIVSLEEVEGTFTRSTGGDEWEGAWTFDPGSGEIDISCTGAEGTSIEISEAPRVGMVVGSIFLLVAIPLVVGFAGFIIVVITGILFLVRPPRRR